MGADEKTKDNDKGVEVKDNKASVNENVKEGTVSEKNKKGTISEQNNEGTTEIKKEEKKDDDPVIRYEIREMSKEDQMRFVKALKKCMENREGPETSEWFRIAG